MMLRRIRIGLWVVVGLAAIAGVILALRPKSDALPVAAEQPLPDIGGPFTLTGADGKPFSTRQLAGQPYVVFFGFTHCPDVCPNSLARLARLRRTIGKGENAFAILFVSVDPERDTPAEIGSYANMFNAPIIALTGSPETVGQVTKQFGVFAAKVPQPGADYSIDHTATMFLMDRTGKFAATLSPDEGDASAIAKLRQIIG